MTGFTNLELESLVLADSSFEYAKNAPPKSDFGGI